METVDYILVGQGVAGTLLGWEMRQAGLRIAVFDDGRADAASRLAAGIINPVSGRKFEVSWQYDTVYPLAKATYRAMEAALGVSVFADRDIWNVWTTAQMRDAFAANPTPYSVVSPETRYDGLLDAPFGAGIVKGANVDLGTLLPAWASHIGVRRETLDTAQLQLTDKGVTYKDLQAKAVIFCEGVASPQNPLVRQTQISAQQRRSPHHPPALRNHRYYQERRYARSPRWPGLLGRRYLFVGLPRYGAYWRSENPY